MDLHSQPGDVAHKIVEVFDRHQTHTKGEECTHTNRFMALVPDRLYREISISRLETGDL